MPETGVEEQRRKIDNRLGEPEALTFPEDWEISSSWRRAQLAPSQGGPANAAEFDVLLGYIDEDGLTKHRVLFMLLLGELPAATLQFHDYRLKQFVQWCEENDIENLNNFSGGDIHRFRVKRRCHRRADDHRRPRQ